MQVRGSVSWPAFSLFTPADQSQIGLLEFARCCWSLGLVEHSYTCCSLSTASILFPSLPLHSSHQSYCYYSCSRRSL